jgi:hypothetical protein
MVPWRRQRAVHKNVRFPGWCLQKFICDAECNSRELLVHTNIVRSSVTLRSRSAKELRYDPVKINLVSLCVKFSVHLFVSFIKSFKEIRSPRKMSRLGCAVCSKVGVRIRKAANCVLPCNVGRGVMLAQWHYEWQWLAAWRVLYNLFFTGCNK